MNNKFTAWIERRILPIANVIQRNRYLQAIQSGFLTCIPIMLLGSISIILTRPLLDYTKMDPSGFAYQFFRTWQVMVDSYGQPVVLLSYMTIYSLSFWAAITISYHLAKRYKMNELLTVMVVGVQFFVLCSFITGDGGINNDNWGGQGLFAGIVIAILVTELYRLLTEKKIGTIQLPGMVPPVLKNSFSAMFPVMITTGICTVISIIFNYGFGLSFPEAVLAVFHPFVLAIDNIFGLTISSLMSQTIWWFGIHNSAVTSMLEPLMYANIASNAASFAQGVSANSLAHIWTEPLWWNFMVIGGSGATLSVAFMLLFSKSKQMKTVGKIAIIPSLFNINEPIIFGIPIVLNPLFFIPWLSAQTINGIISYLCMQGGLINRTFIDPGWNMPAIIGQFLSTMDWRSIVLTIMLIVLDGVIYYPFFKVYEKQKVAEEQQEEVAT